MNDSVIADMAHVIQNAIAPVFLLTGIGALLAVLTNRLGRIIDRARRLEDKLMLAEESVRSVRFHRELATLSQRARLINAAISMAVLSALLVCLVIVSLFLSSIVGRVTNHLIEWLFIAAMLSLVGTLLTFLREIYVATANLRIGPH